MNGNHGRYQVLHISDRVVQHSGEPTPAWARRPWTTMSSSTRPNTAGSCSWPASLSRVRLTLAAGRCAGSYCPVSAGCTGKTRTTAAAAALPPPSTFQRRCGHHLRRWKVDAGDPRVRLGAACTDVHDGGGVRDGQSGVA